MKGRWKPLYFIAAQMKYTRYDFKKNDPGFILGLIVFIILASILAVFASGFSKSFVKDDSASLQEVQTNISGDFYAIQCGIFSKKENADAAIKAIPETFSPFIIETDGKYKVISGIYKPDDSKQKLSELTGSSIDSFEIKYQINEVSSGDQIEINLIAGFIDIIGKFNEKDVKSINTVEFKSWSSDIVQKTENKSEELTSIINRIQSIPDEYTKDNAKEDEQFLYSILDKHKQFLKN